MSENILEQMKQDRMDIESAIHDLVGVFEKKYNGYVCDSIDIQRIDEAGRPNLLVAVGVDVKMA